MKIRIPLFLIKLRDAFDDFVNIPLIYDIRIIDIILVFIGVSMILYYYYTSGLIASLESFVAVILVLIMGILLFPR
jgi:hypothetical protein